MEKLAEPPLTLQPLLPGTILATKTVCDWTGNGSQVKKSLQIAFLTSTAVSWQEWHPGLLVLFVLGKIVLI